VDLVIVVDKLLVGFDAPRNAVLYLAKPLRDHTLLQAIARVNRLSPGKECGLIIDYQGVLQPLTEAMGEYTKLGGDEEFESKDLEGAIKTVPEIVAELGEAAAVCDRFFDGVDREDEEAVDRSFDDEDRRADFYGAVREYGARVHTAFSSPGYLERSSATEIDSYGRRLKWLIGTRVRLQRRYAEKVDFAEYEPKIRKLLDEYVGAKDAEVIVHQFSIFESEKFDAELAKMKTPAAKAYTIANRVKKTITEKMNEDPTLFKRFSEMIERAILAYEAKRMSDADLLKEMHRVAEGVRTRTIDEQLPQLVQGRKVAEAYYRQIKAVLKQESHPGMSDALAANLAVQTDDAVESLRRVNWTKNQDVLNQLELRIGDLFYDTCREHTIEMGLDLAEMLSQKLVAIAKEQRP
jgi:type I restriction enzyme R subunit